MDKLQIALIFLGGFVLSRALVRTRVPERLVFLLLGRRHNGLSTVIGILALAAALLSLFIPNLITVLTLLPVLELLRRAFADRDHPGAVTPLTLAVIYGANIGGMGSVTGTPSNLLFLGYVTATRTPGMEQVGFASWLAWGVPLVLLSVAAAWCVLVLGFRTWGGHLPQVHLPVGPEQACHPLQRQVVILGGLYLVTAFVLSWLQAAHPEGGAAWTAVTALFTLALVGWLYLWPQPGGERILRWRDSYTGLPLRGFGLLALVGLLAGLFYALHLQDWLSARAAAWLPREGGAWMPLALALVTSFSTEVLSNSLVQVGLFLVIDSLGTALGVSPLSAMLIVTLSCTCAFMSPIATGVNALAFGGVRGVSLLRMLAVGALMNGVMAALVAWYVPAWVPWG